jgi:hypothetical protein
MLDEMADHGRPPKMDRVLWGLGFALLLTIGYIIIAEIITLMTKDNTALHKLLIVISIAPVALTCIMVLIACIAFMTVLGRRNSLSLTAELRNREYFNPLGLNVVFSQNYEWFCIEIRNQKILSDNFTISGKGKKKEGQAQEVEKSKLIDNVGDDAFDF